MGQESRHAPAGASTPPKRFLIRACIGSGATGLVYRAYDTVRRHDVALKELTKLNAASLYRFKREFRALANIVHSNLATLYELHATGTTWYLAMELIDGSRSFLEYVRPHRDVSNQPSIAASTHGSATNVPMDSAPPIARPAAPGSLASQQSAQGELSDKRQALVSAEVLMVRLRSALRQVVEGLDVLHRAGMLHRDIKPSNVLIDTSGRVVICDFGLVTEYRRGGEGLLSGTIPYMSPEQACGEPLAPASDIYSVGCMLYEALTGRLPIDGDPFTVLGKKRDIRSVTITPPRQWNPDIDADLDALCMALLHPEPAARPLGSDLLSLLGGRRITTMRPVDSLEDFFVGREVEMAALAHALDDCRHGRCAVSVIVRGTSGSGKSAVVEKFLESLDQSDALVFESRCYESESVPFKALDDLIDALSDHLASLPDHEVEAILFPEIAALCRLFPVMRRVPATASLVATVKPPEEPHALRNQAQGALTTLLVRLSASQPVILYIDDLQWGDLDSAPFLSRIMDMGQDAGAAVLLLATCRSEDADTTPLLRALSEPTPGGRPRDLRAIHVAPLSPDDAEKLARAIIGERRSQDAAGARAATLTDEIIREAQGNPLFVTELARARVHGGPLHGHLSLDEFLAARIERLPSEAQVLLSAIALCGRPQPMAVIGRAVSVQNEAAMLSQLRSGRFIRIRNDGDVELVACYHDRIRETAVATLSERERARLHRRLARTFEGAAERDLDALVMHWRGAGKDSRAARYALRAAELAMRALAFRRAAEYYALVLELGKVEADERLRLQIAKADALLSAGALDDAAKEYEQAASMADESEAVLLRCKSLICLLRAGRMQEAMAAAEVALAGVGLRMPHSQAQALMSVAWRRFGMLMRGNRVRAVRPESAVDPEELRRLDVCYSVATALGLVDTFRGFAMQTRFIGEAIRLGEPKRATLALCTEAGFRAAFFAAGGRQEFEKLLADASELAQAHCDRGYQATVVGYRGLSRYFCHEALGRGAAEIEQAIQAMGSEPELTWETDFFRIYWVNCMCLHGGFGALAKRLPEMLRHASDSGNQFLAKNLRVQEVTKLWLALDKLDHIAPEIHDDSLPEPGDFILLDLFRHLNLVELELYTDKEGVWKHSSAVERVLKRTSLVRMPIIKVWSNEVFARGALLAARLARGSQREEMLEAALRLGREIEREESRMPSQSAAFVAFIRGQVALARGELGAAVAELRQALMLFRLTDTQLFVNPVQLRLGELVGGDEGRELIAKSRVWMREQTIGNPARFVNWVMPFGSPDLK